MITHNRLMEIRQLAGMAQLLTKHDHAALSEIGEGEVAIDMMEQLQNALRQLVVLIDAARAALISSPDLGTGANRAMLVLDPRTEDEDEAHEALAAALGFSVATPSPTEDPEVAALRTCLEYLLPLDDAARRRALEYLQRRFHRTV